MKKRKLSMVVPFYNEEARIKKTFKMLTEYLGKHFPNEHELIFVNDGSTDHSAEIVKHEVQNRPEVLLISYSKNKGRGYALSKGFRKAKGTIVGYIDSDLEINQKYILECIERIGYFDIVVISKYLPGSLVKTTYLRKLAGKIYNLWVRTILKSKVSDHQGGLKIFKGGVIKKILPKVHSSGWLFDTEVLYFAQRLGYKIGEVPVSVNYGFGCMRNSMMIDFLKSFFFIIKLK